jgi:polyhydroxybutyrate depolymerase
MIKDYNADGKRVYVTGISNGGFFTERIGFQIPEKIAAIAVVDAGLTKELESMAAADIPVPALLILGKEDPLVPFEGGTIAKIFGGRGTVLPATETIRFWTQHNHCQADGRTTELSVRDNSDPTRVQQTIYSPTSTGKIVVVDVVEGGGHTWPSGVQYLPTPVIGTTTKQLSDEDIWNFFKDKHSN